MGDLGWFGKFIIWVIVLGTCVMIVRLTKLPEEFKAAVLYVAIAILAIFVIKTLLIPLLG